jgi:signal peptide peptidase SppA
MQLAERDLREAAARTDVHSIILSVDSPGGTVDGTQTLANAVREIGADKPVVTLAGGMMASAAYWIGSASSQIYIEDLTTTVGSIGVVATHVDISEAERVAGRKTTEVTAGKFKRIASNYSPLSSDGRASMQEQVDYLYSQFVSAVAANRGVSEEKVLSDMADGRVFIGQQAIDAGLVDGVSTLSQLVAQLNAQRNQPAGMRAGAAPKTVATKGNSNMDINQLEAAHPQLVREIRASAQASERERIQGVLAQSVPGHEAVVNAMAFDGKSTAGDAAIAVLAAQKEQKGQRKANIESDAPAPLAAVPAPVVDAPEAKKPATAAEFDAAAKAHMSANPGCSYVDAYKAVGGK